MRSFERRSIDEKAGGGVSMQISDVFQKKIYEEINLARGIAVIFVLIGHSFPRVSSGVRPGVAEQFIVNYCYYFHMALFMFLAGFVASRKIYSQSVDFGGEITKSAKRLMVPYLLYSLLTFLLKQVFSIYANNQFGISELWTILLGQNPNGGLWYLWTLFVLSFLVLLLSRAVRRDSVFIAFGILTQIMFFIVSTGFLDNMCRMAIFYIAGVVIARHYDSVLVRYKEFIKVHRASACLPLIAFAIIGVVDLMFLGRGVQRRIYPFTAVLGIYAVMDISLRIQGKNSVVKRFFGELGEYSYDLYLLSYYVQIPIRVLGYSVLNLPYAIVVAAMLSMGLLIPYVVSRFVIRRHRILSGMLLGKWQ